MSEAISARQKNPWLLAIRPKTLGASLAPVLVGSAIAFHEGTFSILIFVVTLIGAMLLQIESNLVNDYFDFKKGSDTKERLGPIRVTSAGLVSPEQMKRAILLVALMCILNGAILIALAGLPILIIGLVSLLCAFLYTAGPLPLAYLGLGDVFVFIFFGPVAVVGTVYAQTQNWSFSALLASLPIGVLSVAILLVNNLRDFEEDKKSAKKTIVVRFGKRFSEKLYGNCLMLPFVIVLIGQYFKYFPPMTSLVLLVFFIDRTLTRDLFKARGQEYNPLLARTAKFLVVFSFLFSIGYLQ